MEDEGWRMEDEARCGGGGEGEERKCGRGDIVSLTMDSFKLQWGWVGWVRREGWGWAWEGCGGVGRGGVGWGWAKAGLAWGCHLDQ